MFNRRFGLPIMNASFDGFSLVLRLLPLGQSDLDLGLATLVEIDTKRHDGIALALGQTDQTVNLLAVKQELSRAGGINIPVTLNLRIG